MTVRRDREAVVPRRETRSLRTRLTRWQPYLPPRASLLRLAQAMPLVVTLQPTARAYCLKALSLMEAPSESEAPKAALRRRREGMGRARASEKTSAASLLHRYLG